MKLMLFTPELILLFGSLVLFMLSTGQMAARNARNAAVGLAALNLVAAFACVCQEGSLFYGAYRIDLFSQLVKVLISTGFLLVLLLGGKVKGIDDDVKPEYYLFLTLSTLGLVLLVSSVELLTIFIALELSSYSMYVAVPMRSGRTGEHRQMESAIKYILTGVLATGVMLFGMSYLFGLTGTTYLAELLPRLHTMMDSPVAIVALIMMLAGFFFKLALFPFHSWVPDVYQGAANETTAFIAAVPKIAAVALLIRLTALATPQGEAVTTLLVILSVCSICYGNLAALVQTDLKRMLGFSGIAHAGYILIGIVTLQDTGYAAALYYITGYMFMTTATFMVICKVSRNGENVTIEDLSGLHKRSPVLALTLAISMFSMAGIPPFVGFMSKFMLLVGAYKAGFVALVIIAAINTAISIFYYLSVVRVVYTANPEGRSDVNLGQIGKLVCVFQILVIIGLGLLPDSVVNLMVTAVRSVL